MSNLTDSYSSEQETKLKEAATNLSPEFLGLLAEWEQLAKDIALMTQRENDLRRLIFAACFADPKEGVNKKDLKGGYQLSAQYKINRTVDAAQLETVKTLLAECGQSFDSVFKFKPELILSGYKGLTGDARKVVDMAITARPGLPALEIVLPKRKAK